MAIGRREVSVALLAVGALLLYTTFMLAASSEAQQGGGSTGGTTNTPQVSCSGGEEPVDTFTGTADQTTPQFEITGDEWNFVFESTRGPSGGLLTIEPLDEGGVQIPGASEFAVAGDSGRSSQISGPGAFSLKIDEDASDTVEDYTVVVCDNANGTSNGQAASQGGSSERSTQNNRDRRDRVERSTIPNRPLPPTGGPPVAVLITVPVLTGAGLLGVGLGLQRRRRR